MGLAVARTTVELFREIDQHGDPTTCEILPVKHGSFCVEANRPMFRGLPETLFYRWEKLYENMGVSELKELRQLRDENTRLKRLVEDLSLDKHILQGIFSKEMALPVNQGRWGWGNDLTAPAW